MLNLRHYTPFRKVGSVALFIYFDLYITPVKFKPKPKERKETMKDGEFVNHHGVKFDYGTFCDYEQKYYATELDGVSVEFHGWNRPDADLRVIVNLPGKRWAKDTNLVSVANLTENQIREYIELAKQS